MQQNQNRIVDLMKSVELFELESKDLDKVLKLTPKCELHLHIEGTLEPELLFKIAVKNGVETKFKTIQELRQAYVFNNLQQFLDIYYQGASVLRDEQDFYELAMAYFLRCRQDNIAHTEIFVDPQTHLANGDRMDAVINGIHRAMTQAQEKFGITSYLIPCFLRHESQQSAFGMFEEALKYQDKIIGFGLDSSEVNNPPEKFARVFQNVREKKFHVVAHAGEQGSSQYVWGALNILKASRIDHGINCLQDQKLVQHLRKNKIPLTVCPLSNLKLKLFNGMQNHPLKVMMDKGLQVTINSDDPAYFGGYLNQNYSQIIKALKLTKKQVIEIVKNSFIASFLPEEAKQKWLQKIDSISAQI